MKYFDLDITEFNQEVILKYCENGNIYTNTNNFKIIQYSDQVPVLLVYFANYTKLFKLLQYAKNVIYITLLTFNRYIMNYLPPNLQHINIMRNIFIPHMQNYLNYLPHSLKELWNYNILRISDKCNKLPVGICLIKICFNKINLNLPIFLKYLLFDSLDYEKSNMPIMYSYSKLYPFTNLYLSYSCFEPLQLIQFN